jgi:hypothetical protein
MAHHKVIADMINAILRDCVLRLQDEAGMDAAACYRSLIFHGLHGLPQHVCGECLTHDLARFHDWIGSDLAKLAEECGVKH